MVPGARTPQCPSLRLRSISLDTKGTFAKKMLCISIHRHSIKGAEIRESGLYIVEGQLGPALS